MASSFELDIQRTAERALRSARTTWGADWTPARGAVAPGRIEILGNHVDYNGGPVLAAAVDRATVILSDDSDELEFLFADFPDSHPISIDSSAGDDLRSARGQPKSHDFVLGVLARMQEMRRAVLPGRMVVATSIPIGSGMSSSAALSVALTLMLNDPPPSGAELVYDAQAAENWTGVPCGTMDQSASVFGQVIRFEGPEGTTSIAPELESYCFVVVDSGVERTLGTSSYPTRVRECGEAVALLESAWDRPVGQLASLDRTDLHTIEMANPPILDAVHLARVRHIVTEIERVSAGESAMTEHNWDLFGELMNASGRSSAGDYEISHPRVESLVRAMQSVPGVVGARMMGGGEGGSTLALLQASAIDQLRDVLVAFFEDESMRSAVVPLAFAPGARLLPVGDLECPVQ